MYTGLWACQWWIGLHVYTVCTCACMHTCRCGMPESRYMYLYLLHSHSIEVEHSHSTVPVCMTLVTSHVKVMWSTSSHHMTMFSSYQVSPSLEVLHGCYVVPRNLRATLGIDLERRREKNCVHLQYKGWVINCKRNTLLQGMYDLKNRQSSCVIDCKTWKKEQMKNLLVLKYMFMFCIPE